MIDYELSLSFSYQAPFDAESLVGTVCERSSFVIEMLFDLKNKQYLLTKMFYFVRQWMDLRHFYPRH